jgi:hypothetical protein
VGKKKDSRPGSIKSRENCDSLMHALVPRGMRIQNRKSLNINLIVS